MGLYSESRKAIEEALRIEPNDPDYNLGAGLVMSYSETPMRAIPDLEKYRALRPRDPEGLLAMGGTFFRAKNYDAAESWFKLAVVHPSCAAEASYYLGRIAHMKGHNSEAVDQWKELAEDQAQPSKCVDRIRTGCRERA